LGFLEVCWCIEPPFKSRAYTYDFFLPFNGEDIPGTPWGILRTSGACTVSVASGVPRRGSLLIGGRLIGEMSQVYKKGKALQFGLYKIFIPVPWVPPFGQSYNFL
jgi:hypothetical protein